MKIKEKFNESLEFSIVRLIFGVLLAIFEVFIHRSIYSSYIITYLYPLITVIVSPWKIKKNDTITYVFRIMVALVYSFGVVTCSQILTGANLDQIEPIMLLYNNIIFVTFAILIFVFINNANVSLLISGILFNILSTADYFVTAFRGTPLSPIDFIKIGTAINVMDNYKLSLSKNLFIGWLLFLLLSIGLFTYNNFKSKHKLKGRTIALGTCVAFIIPMVIVIHGITPYRFSDYGVKVQGYYVGFLARINDMIIKKPENYDAKNIDKMANNYVEKETTKEGQRPDIFVIMNESFADFNVLGDNFNTNEEVLPYFNSLKKNTIRGYAYSSVFGGNTPNSEYEFLTGNSMAFLPDGSIPYQQFIDNYQYSLVANLKKNGYECSATHPYLANGWSRPTVYPALGFDNISFIDSYPQKNLIRDFVSDQEMFEELISRYEKRDKTKPQFTFGITMQNHGSYNYTGNDFSPEIKAKGLSEQYADAEQYLSLIHESDKAFKYFIEYFSKQKDPVVVIMFGDHFPNLNTEYYDEIHGGNFDSLDEQLLKYKIPFVIWTNYDIEEKTNETTSLNYLSEYIYDITGISKPIYSQALSDIQKTIPIINSQGYYSVDKKKFLTVDKASGKEKEVLNEYAQLQYNNIFDKDNKNKKLFPVIK